MEQMAPRRVSFFPVMKIMSRRWLGRCAVCLVLMENCSASSPCLVSLRYDCVIRFYITGVILSLSFNRSSVHFIFHGAKSLNKLSKVPVLRCFLLPGPKKEMLSLHPGHSWDHNPLTGFCGGKALCHLRQLSNAGWVQRRVPRSLKQGQGAASLS